MRGSLFIFGLGYSAAALIRALYPRGWNIAGTTRTAAKAAALAETGITVHLFDRDRPLPDPRQALAGVTHILASVPPDGRGDPVLDQHGADLAALSTLSWAGYLSTTGVYGDAAGAWVNETWPMQPLSARGQARVAAEAGWMALHRTHTLPLHIFRLPGIYGPGRSALDSLRAGTARRLDKPGQVFSRIHVEDIASALLSSIDQPQPGTAYNVADDEPSPTPDVVSFAANLLRVPVPPLEPFDPATLSPMAASFYAECKRVDSTRLRALGWRPRFPTYREGLTAQAMAEGVIVPSVEG